MHWLAVIWREILNDLGVCASAVQQLAAAPWLLPPKRAAITVALARPHRRGPAVGRGDARRIQRLCAANRVPDYRTTRRRLINRPPRRVTRQATPPHRPLANGSTSTMSISVSRPDHDPRAQTPRRDAPDHHCKPAALDDPLSFKIRVTGATVGLTGTDLGGIAHGIRLPRRSATRPAGPPRTATRSSRPASSTRVLISGSGWRLSLMPDGRIRIHPRRDARASASTAKRCSASPPAPSTTSSTSKGAKEQHQRERSSSSTPWPSCRRPRRPPGIDPHGRHEDGAGIRAVARRLNVGRKLRQV